MRQCLENERPIPSIPGIQTAASKAVPTMTLGARVVYYYMSLGLGLCRYGHIFLGAVNGLKGLVNAGGAESPELNSTTTSDIQASVTTSQQVRSMASI